MKRLILLICITTSAFSQENNKFSFSLGMNFYLKPIIIDFKKNKTITYEDMVRPYDPNTNLEGFGLPIRLNYVLNKRVLVSYEPTFRYDEINFLQNNRAGTSDERRGRNAAFTNNALLMHLRSKNSLLVNSLGVGVFNTFQKIRTPVDYYPRSFTGESVEMPFVSYGIKLGRKYLQGGITTSLIWPNYMPISRFYSISSLVLDGNLIYTF